MQRGIHVILHFDRARKEAVLVSGWCEHALSGFDRFRSIARVRPAVIWCNRVHNCRRITCRLVVVVGAATNSTGPIAVAETV